MDNQTYHASASNCTGDVSELIGQTVTGQSSLATAIPVSTIGVREAFTDIVEIEIDADSQTGTFEEGETVKGIFKCI